MDPAVKRHRTQMRHVLERAASKLELLIEEAPVDSRAVTAIAGAIDVLAKQCFVAPADELKAALEEGKLVLAALAIERLTPGQQEWLLKKLSPVRPEEE